MKQPHEIPISDHELLRGLAHPLRRRIMTALERRTASPKELAQELDEPLTKVSYHVRGLVALGLIELVSTTPRRGALEHHYKAVGRTYIPPGVWETLPDTLKQSFAGAWVDQLAVELHRAVASGGLDGIGKAAVRTTALLDDASRAELENRLYELYRDLPRLERESAKRSEERVEPTAFALVIYTPASGPQAPKEEGAPE
jgi:DNA-binding transcriptional ArsR family regulator